MYSPTDPDPHGCFLSKILTSGMNGVQKDDTSTTIRPPLGYSFLRSVEISGSLEESELRWTLFVLALTATRVLDSIATL